MKVQIKSITESTISFNTIGITVRGNSNDTDRFPESIANNIEITNEAQKEELDGLSSLGYITYKVYSESEEATEEATEEVSEEVSEEATKKRGRGRPKGSTNKKPTKKNKKVKKIEKSEGQEEPENSDDVVVVTAEGIKKGSSVKDPSENGDRVKKSLEAMEKLNEEEGEKPDAFIDKEVDISEKTGQDAVISEGQSKTKKVKMKTSILPESEQEKKASEKENDLLDELFEDGDDDLDDRFIEI
jgi:hypothetical protein